VAVIAWLAVALLAFYVPAVGADSAGFAPAASSTTQPATDVAVASAVLNGSIKTLGQATQWEFQYGAITVHDHSTPLSQIPAGRGTVRVSARVTGLRAGTTYRFRVIAISGIGSNYVETYYAASLAFTTKRWHGALLLVRNRLPVSGGVVRARLRCSSKYVCGGRLSISTSAAGSPSGAVPCATKSFRIPAGTRRTVRTKLSQSCLALLTKAPDHRLKGSFSSATTTGQRGQDRSVDLVLGGS
jgi:hypothetical protein